MGEIITKLFRCIPRKNVMLFLSLSLINLIIEIVMTTVLTLQGEYVQNSGIILLISFIAVLYCAVIRILLEDSKKMEPSYCKPYEHQSELVYKLFNAIYKQKKDNSFLIKIFVAIIIIFLAFVEIPAIKACYESNMPLILYGYFLVPFFIMVAVAGSLIVEEIAAKAKLNAMQRGEFTYAEVECVERYESFVRRGRYLRVMSRHYYIILEDIKGNRGRFRVDENQYALIGYASGIYLIRMNNNSLFFSEPEVFVCMRDEF